VNPEDGNKRRPGISLAFRLVALRRLEDGQAAVRLLFEIVDNVTRFLFA